MAPQQQQQQQHPAAENPPTDGVGGSGLAAPTAEREPRALLTGGGGLDAAGSYPLGRRYKSSLGSSSSSDFDLSDSGSDLYGAMSGGGDHKCDDGVSLALLLTTFAGIAVAFFVLFTTITMAGRRRRRKRGAADADPAGEEEEEEGPGRWWMLAEAVNTGKKGQCMLLHLFFDAY